MPFCEIRFGGRPVTSSPLSRGRRRSTAPPSLGELAGRREDRLFLRHHLDDVVLAALDVEDELVQEGLVIVLAERLVALGEVVARLDLQALERLDQLRAVLAPLEARLLDAELEEVHRLEVGLHVAVGERPRGIDLLEPCTASSKNFLRPGVLSGPSSTGR